MFHRQKAGSYVINQKKMFKVKVSTMSEDLNSVMIEPSFTGEQLFDMVCRIIGLREVWYFGLSFTNKKGQSNWLQLEKKISKQDVPMQSDGLLHFLFLVKFYPENVDDEPVQDITRHLLFLQIKQSILSMNLYCQPEAAVLLSSYAVQAMYGDCNNDFVLVMDKLLPQSVIGQYDMTQTMWEERIRTWWANNAGICMEDAEIEYLRIAQDLDMFGIQYYQIQETGQLASTTLLKLIGISAHGIGFYETNNKLNPSNFVSWADFKNLALKKGEFTLSKNSSEKLHFRSEEELLNASILNLSMGYKSLYERRRKPDLLEVQQMKIQANEQRKRRKEDQERLKNERELRIQAETLRDQYKMEIDILKDELAAIHNMVKIAEEANVLIAEKARVSEKEALELSKRANEAEAEVQRIKLSQLKAEENRIGLERRVRDAELIVHRLLNQDCGMFAARCGNELCMMIRDGINNKFMDHSPFPTQNIPGCNNLLQNGNSGRHINSNNTEVQPPPSFSSVPINSRNSQSTSNILNSALTSEGGKTFNSSKSHTDLLGNFENLLHFDKELQDLYSEFETSRSKYFEENRTMKEKLNNFGVELDSLKRTDDNQLKNGRIFVTKSQARIK